MVVDVVALVEIRVIAVSRQDWKLWKIRRECRLDENDGEVVGSTVLNSGYTLFVKVFRMCQDKPVNVQVSKDMQNRHWKKRTRMSYDGETC